MLAEFGVVFSKLAVFTGQWIVATTKCEDAVYKIGLTNLPLVGAYYSAIAARLATRPSQWVVPSAAPVDQARITLRIVDHRETPICLWGKLQGN
jgi:hypothetical protein